MKTFETKLTVRIYDIKLAEQLNELYKRNPNRYQTKNQLLVELLEIGLKEKQKEFPTPPNAPAGAMKIPVLDSPEITAQIKELRQLLEDMHEYDKKHIEGLLAHLKMSERLSAAIYNLLFAVATDAPVTPIQVELGYFDEIPPRFIAVLSELLKEVLKENKDDGEVKGDENVRLAS